MKTRKALATGTTAALLVLGAGWALAQGTAPSAGSATTKTTTVTPAKPVSAKAPKAAEATKASPVLKAGVVAKSVICEIVDPACYLVNGAHGDSHKECATACAKAGQTLAVLEKKTNKLYLLVAGRPGEDPNKDVLDFIAQTVLVKGKIYTRGGTSGIMVASVEPYSAKAGAQDNIKPSK